MKRLELAVRRYRQIVPDAVRSWAKFPFREIRLWLSDEVCPVVEDYCQRPTFREFASWPVRSLRPDAQTAERKLIDAIQQAIRQCARTLSRLADAKRVRRKLEELYPPRRTIIQETVEIGSDTTACRDRVIGTFDEMAIELRQVAQLAKATEEDLVCIEDYFEPVQEWVGAEGERPIQRGELIVSLNPELHAIGNFVVRCFFRRLELRCQTLGSMHRKCLAAARKLGRVFESRVEEVEQSWTELQRQTQELRVACQTQLENVLRDSCVILTQVYAAFHPSPELTWLGLPAEAVDRGVAAIRARLSGFRNAEMMDRIATALSDLERIYDDRPRNRSAREEAIAAGGLVLCSNPRAVHWETREIFGPWHDTMWNFLRELARKARLKAAVVEKDLYEDAKSDSIMSTNANRLKKLLPPTLRRLIIPGGKARSYRLKLEAYRIHLFD